VSSSPTVSFEFFPAKTPETQEKLMQAAIQLGVFNPEYISVTYGAGGSTQGLTLQTFRQIQEKTGIPVAAHLTCVGANRDEIDTVARTLWDSGIKRIVALRGDVPGHSGDYTPRADGYAYAVDLVSGLRALHPFDISVAAYPETHPQAPSASFDIDYLRRKFDAGADRAITQFCFDTDAYLRFRDRCALQGITKPIVPGIVLVNNFAQSRKFAALCGTAIPDRVYGLLDGITDPVQAAMIGASFGIEQCEHLRRNGINQFHFYTLNRADIASAVCHWLGLSPSVNAATGRIKSVAS
jgi:methylenetetrahydrofolate reductase (NADPH)